MIFMNNAAINPIILEKTLKIRDIIESTLCARCWGRIFSQDIEGTNNLERGEYILQILMEKTCENDNLNNDYCYICDNIFQFMENECLKDIKNSILNSKVEFSTFLVGCRLPSEIIHKQDLLYSKLDYEPESIKKEINREIGKFLSMEMGNEVDFDNPNLVIMVDFKTDRTPNLELQLNPLFIEGRYRKLIRGIPQTKWPCRKCKGKGCENCNYTGKLYMESVEELISPLIIEETHGIESKFHGAGREDIDVRMLGTGRPFVVEVKEPQKRTLDLTELERKINLYAAGKVEVSDLKLVGKERRSQIKTSSTSTYKVYRAIVDLDKEVSNDNLKILSSLDVIEQRTPIRVSHRRADLIRKRRIRDLKVKKLDQERLELIIECEGGLYIKELISGDEYRTKPSVTSLLQTPARCVELDVIDVQN
jgi:tRNA pseudouridine synthase 10